MVTPEQLASLDLLLWLRTGQDAALRLRCSQSTVSRQAAACCEMFGLELRRCGGSWQLHGNTVLLAMERHVHQLLRLRSQMPLRLECTAWDQQALALPLPDGWIAGNFDELRNRPLQLLRDRVIDAWISSFMLADLPDADDPELAVLPLTRLPVWLLADRRHPLAGIPHLSLGDLQRFPSLRFPRDEAPCFHDVISQQGIGCDALKTHRYCINDWEGRSADGVTISQGNPIGLGCTVELVRLDWEFGAEIAQSLVVRRDLLEHEAIQRLLLVLRQRAAAQQVRHPSLELVA